MGPVPNKGRTGRGVRAGLRISFVEQGNSPQGRLESRFPVAGVHSRQRWDFIWIVPLGRNRLIIPQIHLDYKVFPVRTRESVGRLFREGTFQSLPGNHRTPEAPVPPPLGAGG